MHIVGFIIRIQFVVLDKKFTNFNNILVFYLQMVSAFIKLQHCSVDISAARNKYCHCVVRKNYVL